MSKTLVQTSYGMVQGVQEGAISSWKGIPYAQPPLGARRFRPPQPPEAWTDVLQTTQFGPMAMQPPSMPAELLRRLSMSEDCLTLNIWSQHWNLAGASCCTGTFPTSDLAKWNSWPGQEQRGGDNPCAHFS